LAALAGAVGEDLFVGEDGLTGGAPVGGGEGAIGEPFFEELKEDPNSSALRAFVELHTEIAQRRLDSPELPE